MRYILKIIIAITISSTGLAQEPLELKFALFEMELLVNNEVVDHSNVGTDCKLIYKYRQKRYIFSHVHHITNERMNLLFNFIERENDENYYSLYEASDNKSRFIVRDSIYKKRKIEFINTNIEKNGDVVSYVYRFSGSY